LTALEQVMRQDKVNRPVEQRDPAVRRRDIAWPVLACLGCDPDFTVTEKWRREARMPWI
jgi:hypothetical protein